MPHHINKHDNKILLFCCVRYKGHYFYLLVLVPFHGIAIQMLPCTGHICVCAQTCRQQKHLYICMREEFRLLIIMDAACSGCGVTMAAIEAADAAALQM